MFKSKLIKYLITGSAVAVIILKFLKPEFKIDSSLIFLFALVFIPWLSNIKSIEIPGAGKVEFDTKESEKVQAKVLRSDTKKEQNRKSKINNEHEKDDLYKEDNYATIIWKLIPVEVFILYIIIYQISNDAFEGYSFIKWVLFGVFVIMTPIYLRYIHKVKNRTQLLLSSLIFICLIFAIGLPFESLHWYNPIYGATLLAFVTAFSPFINLRSN